MMSSASRAPRRDVFLLVALLVGALVHLAAYYPSLPDRVPSHFDAHGVADGWMSKDAFVLTMTAVYALTGGFFVILAQALPSIPTSMINVPNREYWLAPERRAKSLGELARRLTRFGAVTVVLVLALVHESILVALERKETLTGFLIVMAVYGMYTVIWCIGLIRTFGRPPVDPLAGGNTP